MKNEMLSDKELDSLLKNSAPDIADNGFSQAVMRSMRRRRILSGMIPFAFGALGFLITAAACPSERLVSVILKLTSPLFDASRITSGEIFLFLASRGIDPALLWLFLLIPLLVVPFALQQE